MRVVDEYLYLVSFGAPGTTKKDLCEGIFGPNDLIVKRKPRIRKAKRKK